VPWGAGRPRIQARIGPTFDISPVRAAPRASGTACISRGRGTDFLQNGHFVKSQPAPLPSGGRNRGASPRWPKRTALRSLGLQGVYRDGDAGHSLIRSTSACLSRSNARLCNRPFRVASNCREMVWISRYPFPTKHLSVDLNKVSLPLEAFIDAYSVFLGDQRSHDVVLFRQDIQLETC
jgi:hypothetical protein